jgi:hypothetical protein
MHILFFLNAKFVAIKRKMEGWQGGLRDSTPA